MFGCNLSFPEITCTRCSTAAAMVEIAAHLRNSIGLSSFTVAWTKDSIQDGHFRSALPFVVALVVFEAVGIGFADIAFVPPYLAIVRNLQHPAILERDFLDKVCLDRWNDFIF